MSTVNHTAPVGRPVDGVTRLPTADSGPVEMHSGDRMTQPEFHAAYLQSPEGFRAELINGVVFIDDEIPGCELRNGDRMTQPEFHAAYLEAPPDVKAELIDGVVYLASSARMRHGTSQNVVSGLATLYAARTPGITPATEASAILDPGGEVRPDTFLRIDAERLGLTRINDRGYLEGPPEVVVEVSHASRSIDLHDKRRLYARAGVPEYFVLSIGEETLHRFHLQAGGHDTYAAGETCRSRLMPGLWLDVAAILVGDSAAAIATLETGLASPDHAEFVARLAAARDADDDG